MFQQKQQTLRTEIENFDRTDISTLVKKSLYCSWKKLYEEAPITNCQKSKQTTKKWSKKQLLKSQSQR